MCPVQDIYKGWHTRKFKGKKNEKSRERDYAVKVAKKERATKLVTEAVANAVKVQGLTDKDDKTAEESALQVVEDEMKKALKEDLTKTLKVMPVARGHCRARSRTHKCMRSCHLSRELSKLQKFTCTHMLHSPSASRRSAALQRQLLKWPGRQPSLRCSRHASGRDDQEKRFEVFNEAGSQPCFRRRRFSAVCVL